jgi:hypothetical protein
MSLASLLSIWACVWQPQQGVPKFLPAVLNLENMQYKPENSSKKKYLWITVKLPKG